MSGRGCVVAAQSAKSPDPARGWQAPHSLGSSQFGQSVTSKRMSASSAIASMNTEPRPRVFSEPVYALADLEAVCTSQEHAPWRKRGAAQKSARYGVTAGRIFLARGSSGPPSRKALCGSNSVSLGNIGCRDCWRYFAAARSGIGPGIELAVAESQKASELKSPGPGARLCLQMLPG